VVIVSTVFHDGYSRFDLNVIFTYTEAFVRSSFVSQGFTYCGLAEGGGASSYRIADVTASLILYSSETSVGNCSTKAISHASLQKAVTRSRDPSCHLLPYNGSSLTAGNTKCFFLNRRLFHKMLAFGRKEGNCFAARVKKILTMRLLLLLLLYLLKNGRT
jgi:hypothetical protein